MNMLEKFLEDLGSKSDYIFSNLIYTVGIILFFFIIYIIGKRIITKIYSMRFNIRKIDFLDVRKRKNTLMKVTINIWRVIIYFISLISIVSTWGFDIQALLTGAGILGVFFAFASQNLMKDLLAGFFHIFEDNYSVGDYIEVNDISGTVVDLGLRTTSIKSWTGEVHIIQNSLIEHVKNYTTGTGLAVVDVRVEYLTDLDKCLNVLENLLLKLRAENQNITNDPTILGVNELGEIGYDIRIIAEVKPETHWSVQRNIKTQVIKEFKNNDINIAYSQIVYKNI